MFFILYFKNDLIFSAYKIFFFKRVNICLVGVFFCLNNFNFNPTADVNRICDLWYFVLLLLMSIFKKRWWVKIIHPIFLFILKLFKNSHLINSINRSRVLTEKVGKSEKRRYLLDMVQLDLSVDLKAIAQL